MPAIAFHFNVTDRTAYVCRLVRKARRGGARVVITGERAQLDAADKLLWTFDPLAFIPHWRGRRVEELPPRLADTPTLLLEDPSGVPAPDVLVNLGEPLPAHYEAYPRVVEIVSRDGPDRASARERWKQYAAAGHAIERHDVNA